MPTPVPAARQCLSNAAVTALDAAVASARRRAHAQTTSLHLISSLLAPPAPPLLRDALARARSAAYSPRVQLKALELCFAVSLDRLPSSSSSSGTGDDPPVSNSLMAAIKRSQANQRRNPDTFHFYHQAATAQPPAAVKVELSQLLLAILDDPVVSRVFGEAGFRNGDIKLAILRPAPPMPLLGRLPTRSRPPPLFLCSFAAADDADVPSPAGNLAGAGEENCRRIGEILSRGRNPMLIGVGAASAAADFAAASPYRILPVGPTSIEQTELGVAAAMASATSGLMISVGDLKELVPDDGELQERGRRVVAEVTRVLETHKVGRVWVMGWSATYETYLTFLSKFPLVDKDWDLQLLPITAVRARGSPAGLMPPATAAAAFSHDGAINAQQAAVEAPEAALLQEDVDLEAGRLETRQLSHQTSTQLEEIGDSQAKAIEGEQTPLMSVGDIETASCRSNLQVENGASSTASKESNLKLDLKVSLFLMTISMIPLIDTLFLRGSANTLPLTLKLTAFFAFTAFVSAICLMFHTLKLMTMKPLRLISINQLKVSKVLLTISAVSLFLTCIFITYSLLPKAYHFLPLVLLPSLLVAGFHFLCRAETDHRETRPEESKTLKKALKSAIQLTLSLVTTSFSGFIGDLLGIYHKAKSLGGQYSYIKASVYLMLGAGLAGILALLLCRLLSSNDGHRRSGLWQRAILATANIVMLFMLVPALLMIAATILHGLLVAAVFPVIAGAATWLFLEFCTAAGADDGCADDGKTEQGTMYAIAVAVASVSFGAILAMFAGLLGGSVSNEQLKVCAFFLASAFVAAVSLGVLTFGAPPKKASVAFAAMVLACCGLGTLVLAALALFYQIGRVTA